MGLQAKPYVSMQGSQNVWPHGRPSGFLAAAGAAVPLCALCSALVLLQHKRQSLSGCCSSIQGWRGLEVYNEPRLIRQAGIFLVVPSS